MHRKIKLFVERNQNWAAPLAMVFFLLAGLQIGAKIGSSQTQELNAKTINQQNLDIANKDAIIREKDLRMRALQDRAFETQDKNSISSVKSADAAIEAARAAQAAAAAAAKTAETVNNKLKDPE
jgi:uncharacterized protein YfeS